MAAELFDLAENFIHIAGILAQNAAFEHQSIGLTGSIPYLAVACDSLIGFNFQNCAALGRAVDINEPHIRNFQIRRAGAGIDRM